jgi:hypothetical protein
MNTDSKIQKTFFFMVLWFTFISVQSQVVITADDMPDPGDKMVFGIMPQPGNAVQGYTNAGTGITWNFLSVTPAIQDTNSYISPTSSEIQFICIAIFNNPFDSLHDATAAKQGQSIQVPMGVIQLSNVFEFFRKTSNAFTFVGRSASINGVPTCIRNIPVDRIFKFPFGFGDTLQSNSAYSIQIPGMGYYGQTLNRQSHADAWGTVITPSGSFNALRIKSILNFTDSVYYESMGIGYNVPHTETHYTWLSNDLKFPVFVIEEKGVNFGGTIAIWADTAAFSNISELRSPANISVFPNPAKSFITVHLNEMHLSGEELVLTDLTGKILIREKIRSPIQQLQLKDVLPGIYILKSISTGESVKIVIH